MQLLLGQRAGSGCSWGLVRMCQHLRRTSLLVDTWQVTSTSECEALDTTPSSGWASARGICMWDLISARCGCAGAERLSHSGTGCPRLGTACGCCRNSCTCYVRELCQRRAQHLAASNPESLDDGAAGKAYEWKRLTRVPCAAAAPCTGSALRTSLLAAPCCGSTWLPSTWSQPSPWRYVHCCRSHTEFAFTVFICVLVCAFKPLLLMYSHW
jgi:hypothetical protein